MNHPLTDERPEADRMPPIKQTIDRIRAGLKRRSSRSWCIRWEPYWSLIRITAWHAGRPANPMTPEETAELANLMGFARIGSNGICCQLHPTEMRQMIDRANGTFHTAEKES